MSSTVVRADDASVVPSTWPASRFPLSPRERGWPHRHFSILDHVLGPDGHGPSSSHTMAPQLMALAAIAQLGGQPETATIVLFNSFAGTGVGHRTNIAVTAGLLGLELTDKRTPRALDLAVERNLRVHFTSVLDSGEHVNTIAFDLRRGTVRVVAKAVSLGGGNMEIVAMDREDVRAA